MNIKDPAVHELARQLAARRGTTVTGAVRQALGEALEREKARRSGLADRALAVAAEIRALSDEPYLSDEEIYDERGLPR